MRLCSIPLVLLVGLVPFLPAVAEEEGATPLIGDLANGTRLYRVHCSVCHGFDGSGHGPARATLRTPPADHRDGSLMNSRDNGMLFRVTRDGCASAGCGSKAMPAFGANLSALQVWDLVAYLRSLHLPLTFFFPAVDQYVVKRYPIGQIGNDEFKAGQLERLKQALGKVEPADLNQTVFTLFRAARRRTSPELVPQEPRLLAQLQKENKLGYVLFLDLIGPRDKKVSVGLALDRDYTITKLVTTLTDPALAGEYNRRFEAYVGRGKRGDKPDFNLSKDNVGKIFDSAVTRIYALAVEGANAFELEERERSWADDTF